MTDAPTSGSVIRYPYLWKWQRDNGETEGRKDRPVCVLLSIPQGASPTWFCSPFRERPRAPIRSLWITVSEFNYDIAERSYYFDPGAEILGTFSKGFLAKIAVAAKPFMVARSAKVSRTD